MGNIFTMGYSPKNNRNIADLFLRIAVERYVLVKIILNI